MTDLNSLAERCEKATGSDRELDRDLADAVGLKGSIHKRVYEPKFTASIDAAMTLARDYLLVALSDIAADGLPGCCLVSDTSTNPPREHWGIASGEDREGRLARCIVAAALRARAGGE